MEKEPYLFTSLQLEEIVNTTASLKTRLSIISLLGPRLIDPNGRIAVFTDMFRFADDKRAVEEVLKNRANMLSRSQFVQGDHSRRGSASTALLRSNSGFNSPAATARRSSVGVKGLLSPTGMYSCSSSRLTDNLITDEPTASVISKLFQQTVADRDACNGLQSPQSDSTISSLGDRQVAPSALVKIYTDNLKSAAKVSSASSAYDSFRKESSQVEQIVRRIESSRTAGPGGSAGNIKAYSALRRESKLTSGEKSSAADREGAASVLERHDNLGFSSARDLLDADAPSLDNDIVAHYQQELDRQSQRIYELERRAEVDGKLHQEEVWNLRAELKCLEKEIEVLRARALGEIDVVGGMRDLEEDGSDDDSRKAVHIAERVSIETYAGPVIVRKELSLPPIKYTSRTSSFYESGGEHAAISNLLSDYGSTVAQLKSVEQELVRHQLLVRELQRDKEAEASSARRSAGLAARAVQRRIEIEQQLADALYHCEQLRRELTSDLSDAAVS